LHRYFFNETNYPIIAIMMNDIYLKQLIFEIESWKRTMDFIENEIVFMKGRMSQILREYPDNSLLNAIEQYQNWLLVQDKMIQIFRNDLEKQIQAVKSLVKDTNLLMETLKRQKKFRVEIETAHSQFEKMRGDFYLFFCERFYEKMLQNAAFSKVTGR